MADILDYFVQTDYVSFGVIAALPCAVIAIYGFIQIASAITSGKNDMQRFNGKRTQQKCSNSYQSGNQYNNINSNINIDNNNNTNTNMDINNSIVSQSYGRQHGRKQRTLDADCTNAVAAVAATVDGEAPTSRKRPSSDGGAQWCDSDVGITRGRGTSSYNVYGTRYMSSCAEDKQLESHNRGHRNSSSSEATGTDDINSSHESLDKKKSLSSRQRRQMRRQQQHQQQHQPHPQQQQQGKNNVNANENNKNASNNNNNNNNKNNNSNQSYPKQIGKTFQNKDFPTDCFEVLTRKEQMATSNNNTNKSSNNSKRTMQQQQQQQQQNSRAGRGKSASKQPQQHQQQQQQQPNNNCTRSKRNNMKENKQQSNASNSLSSSSNNSYKFAKNHQSSNYRNNNNKMNNNNNNTSNSSSAVSSPSSSVNSSPCSVFNNQRYNNNNNHNNNININIVRGINFNFINSSNINNNYGYMLNRSNPHYATPPLRQYEKLNLKDFDLLQHLRRFLVSTHLMRVYGFPVDSVIQEGAIEVFKCHPFLFPMNTTATATATSAAAAAAAATTEATLAAAVAAAEAMAAEAAAAAALAIKATTTTMITASANETVINCNDGLSTTIFEYNNTDMSVTPTADAVANGLSKAASTDSGNVSPRSLDSDTSCDWNEFPQSQDADNEFFTATQQSLAKQCTRCKADFLVDELTGQYLTREDCTFHWGKFQRYFDAGEWLARWTCCMNDDVSAPGCSVHDLHVWSGSVMGVNGPYTDFVQTRRRDYNHDHAYPTECDDQSKPLHQRGVFALDCEMSYTGRGLEATKVTVVGINGQLVYEQFVRPDVDIVDYNTRFSGVTAADLNRSRGVKSLAEVQRDLLQFIDADTILIGHGLDNDLRALRIVHKTLIDTSIVFPHHCGFPYRRALKHLTKIHLKRDIQCGDGLSGHSSFEDSRACMELMLWRIRKELEGNWQYDY